MHVKRLLTCVFVLSVVFATDVAALERMIVYQTQVLKVGELHRVNKDKVDLVIVELDKLERLEAELTRQANFSPNAKESDGEKAVRGQLNQLTLNAIGRAWKGIIQAQQQGVNIKRLPAVFFRGKVYHEVHDIRAILKP